MPLPNLPERKQIRIELDIPLLVASLAAILVIAVVVAKGVLW